MAPKQRESSASPRLVLLAALLAGTAVAIGSCRSGESSHESDAQPKIPGYRPTEHKWAERIDLPGVPNLHKVSEDLYRGAQPSAEGMKQLEKLGIKTIVNLRFLTSDRRMLKGTQLDYEHINTTTLTTDTRDVIRFLKIATDPERTPVFVHCNHGVDRAGVMCAAYRIVVEDWTKEEAIQEMTQGGFTSRAIKKNLLNYIRRVDVEEIRRSTGLRK